ncbi:GGDEF domain-containing protein, partial [Pseudomonas sp. MWU13-2860]
MLAPIKPANEATRIQALHGLNVLDSAPEERFDRLTRLAKRLFNVPIALVTLVDSDRQWFKSCVGLGVSETPR